MGKYIKKNLRGNWQEEDLQNAMRVMRTSKLSTNAAAIHCKVQRRTFKAYLAAYMQSKSRMGRKIVLSPQQDKELSKRNIRLAQTGYPITSQILRMRVFTYCEKTIFQIHLCRKQKWLVVLGYRVFLCCNPITALRKAQNLNPGRAQKLNCFTVSDYFGKLKITMEELGIMNKPECIYNVNEKGYILCLHKQPLVLTQKSGKRVNLVAVEHGKNVTTVSCGYAIASAIPPMLLFKGQRIKGEWLEALPPGSIAQMTSCGSMTTEASVNWLTHFSHYKVAGSCLLVFDKVTSHLDQCTVEAADHCDITLLRLPSKTTHELQPMDKSVF